jgi:hypothetical protein
MTLAECAFGVRVRLNKLGRDHLDCLNAAQEFLGFDLHARRRRLRDGASGTVEAGDPARFPMGSCCVRWDGHADGDPESYWAPRFLEPAP